MHKNKKIFEIKKSIYGLKDNFKPYKFTSSFNSNYVEYKSDGSEDENLSIKEYLDEIRAYLSDIINDHKNKVYQRKKLAISLNQYDFIFHFLRKIRRLGFTQIPWTTENP